MTPTPFQTAEATLDALGLRPERETASLLSFVCPFDEHNHGLNIGTENCLIPIVKTTTKHLEDVQGYLLQEGQLQVQLFEGAGSDPEGMST